MDSKKTWKRELAVALLVFWGYIITKGDVSMADAITMPVFLYVMAAFGMDSYARQVKK